MGSLLPTNIEERVARLLFPHGSIRRVLWGPLRGYRYLVQPAMGLTFAFGKGTGDRFLADRIEKGTTVFDIGANRGQFTLFLAKQVGKSGVVIAFEPIEELADVVRKNADLNGLSQVETVTAAVSEDSGTATFEYLTSRSTAGNLRDREPEYSLQNVTDQYDLVEVRTVALDDLVPGRVPPPDILKIDVEGGAAAVLEGAEQVLDLYAPGIYVELHGPEERKAVENRLLDRSYRGYTRTGSAFVKSIPQGVSSIWCEKV